MPNLIVAVIHEPDLANDVMLAWQGTGVKGATLLHSAGMEKLRRAGLLREDLPLIPSLSALESAREVSNATIMAVVSDQVDVDAVVAATEEVVGRLGDPHTGILFVLPVTRVFGGQV